MKSALVVAQKVKLEVFGESPTVASSIVQVSQLADPKAHVAIRAVANSIFLVVDPEVTRRSLRAVAAVDRVVA
jgi:hypothetical protein